MQHSKRFSVAARFSILLLLVGLICGLFVGCVSAQGSVVDSVPIVTSSTATWNFASYSRLGQGFTGNGFYVTEAEFVLYRQSSSVGDVFVVAEIYASDGQPFGSDKPVGSALAVSTPGLLNALPSAAAAVFTFMFDGSFQVQSGVNYFIAVSVVGGDLAGGSLYCRSTTVGANGGAFVGYTSTWGIPGSAGSHNLMFVLYGVASVQPSPSPSVDGDGGGVVGNGSLFFVFAVLVLVVWVLALIRGSVGFYALSSGLWVLFGFVLQVVGEPGSGFVAGFTIVSFLLGVVMAVLCVVEAARLVKSRSSDDGGVF